MTTQFAIGQTLSKESALGVVPYVSARNKHEYHHMKKSYSHHFSSCSNDILRSVLFRQVTKKEIANVLLMTV